MSYISPEIVRKVKKIDLLTYLQNYDPDELVKIGNEIYATKTHDSLIINNGLWNWFSRGIGGKTALDYLIKVKGYSFKEAVNILSNNQNIENNFDENYLSENDEKKLILPPQSVTNNRIINYLRSRRISEKIINYCIQNELIYEDLPNHNIVFIGYDNQKNVRYAGIRATISSRYMYDVKGSDKRYGFKFNSEIKSDTIHVFESAIDLLSYATILELKNKNWKNENMISLAGINLPAKSIYKSKIPSALEKYLIDNSNISNIVLHLDNDIAGRNASQMIQTKMKEKYKVTNVQIPIGKDVNDYLCNMIENKKINKKERER